MAAYMTLAFLNCGQQIHGRIIRRGLDGNLALSNALIDIDLVSWTTMMIGYGTHGYGEEVVELFDKMVSPDQEIYGCEVDLLGRAGKVEEAYELIESMPFKPDECVWGPFLELVKHTADGKWGVCKNEKVDEKNGK
ncbi:putative pentatricopeptide repeat-containing protein [Vitis vinifera]|uniref:Putative pentatricopeptide repeat-containing protein n=1 Tax=Vitis vinifera TaxID=29760 RepID=A0A438GL43_VITVI|nr:putative pentatricopeptide repeat-containing protein [Vitis vinifera]